MNDGPMWAPLRRAWWTAPWAMQNGGDGIVGTYMYEVHGVLLLHATHVACMRQSSWRRDKPFTVLEKSKTAMEGGEKCNHSSITPLAP